MDLILWRHADAENRLPDDARRLTDKGRMQALRVASWLAPQLPQHYRVLASPALRTQETAAVLTDHALVERAVSTAATPEMVLAAAGWPAGTGTVIVVGHQPTLGAAAALALTGEPLAWRLSRGALWWLVRDAGGGVTVRAVIGPAALG